MNPSPSNTPFTAMLPKYPRLDPITVRSILKPACGLLVQELNDWFFQRDIKQIAILESLLMKSANGASWLQDLSDMKEIHF